MQGSESFTPLLNFLGYHVIYDERNALCNHLFKEGMHSEKGEGEH